MCTPYRMFVALAFVLLFPGTALAELDATRAEAARVSFALQALGYTAISDIDVVGNRFIVDARSAQGHDVDVYVHRRTLRVIRERRS
jgi:hypothetical protein